MLPGVRVRNLASRVLGLAASRLPADWEAAHGVRPLAALTHTGPGHAGTCCRAAGWTHAGETSGRRGPKRRIWILPLAGNWRRSRRFPTSGSGTALPGWARPREKKAGRTLPEMFPGEAERKAAYRLLSNPEVEMDDILKPHV